MSRGIGRRKDRCLWATGSFVPHSTGSLALKHIFPLSSPIRAKTLGHWPVSGDEHSFPLLVLLPPRSLQQKDVWGIQAAGSGGCQRRLQVSEIGAKILGWSLRDGERGYLCWVRFQNCDRKFIVYIFHVLYKRKISTFE